MTPGIMKLTIIFAYFITFVQSALVTSYQCSGIDRTDFRLAPFVIDAALDEDAQILKFFLNSKVFGLPSNNSKDVIISDVNTTTNKYTTFHVDIQFMGKTFVDEDIRFCDILAVKHTEEYFSSPRFGDKSKRSDGVTDNPSPPNQVVRSEKLEFDKQMVNNQNYSLSTSNSTVENYFNNSTGNWVLCPLYQNDSIVLYYEVDISDHYLKLGSYTVSFHVYSNDDSSQLIGCNKAYVTPQHSNKVKETLSIGIPVLLLFTGLINFFTVIYSSYQESSSPSLFVASTICNENLLKQLDATVEEIIMYFQFALFIGGLDLQYPGFYQPLIGQIRWCALMGFSFIREVHKGLQGTTELDNIYVTLNLDGLKNLATYSNDLSYYSCWPNFMLLFVIWTIIMVVSHQSFLASRRIFLWFFQVLKKKNLTMSNTRYSNANSRKLNYDFTMKTNFYCILGQVLQNFLMLFGFPFLVLTSFMLYNEASISGHRKLLPSTTNVKNNIFSSSVPYDQIFSPNFYFIIENPSDIIGSDPVNIHNGLNFTNQNFANSNSTKFVKESGRKMEVSTSSVALGSILLMAWIIAALYFILNYLIALVNWKIRINKKVSHLYTSMKTILMWGFCYSKYHPDRVYYVIVDLSTLLMKLLIIGCLQSYGTVQVSLLIIVESFSVALLFSIKPYFVKMTWTTSRWMLPVARFMVTVLCIAYIRSLEFSELTRTYVAYVQLVIHVIVAIVFIIHLFYCMIITVLSIIKMRRHNIHDDKCVGNQFPYNSVDEFNTQFEYHPIINPSFLAQLHDNKGDLSRLNRLSQRTEKENAYENDIDSDDEDPYYRARSEKQLQKVRPHQIDKAKFVISRTNSNFIADNNSAEESLLCSNSQSVSFEQQQKFSNIRKQNNDYTFRESDLIYRKYFTDDSIDPEIRALWASRNNWNLYHNDHYTAELQQEIKIRDVDEKSPKLKEIHSNDDISKTNKNTHIISNLKSIFKYETSEPIEVKNQSFQVSRPRKLIVKSYDRSANDVSSPAKEHEQFPDTYASSRNVS